jgi:hypothetical protein
MGQDGQSGGPMEAELQIGQVIREEVQELMEEVKTLRQILDWWLLLLTKVISKWFADGQPKVWGEEWDKDDVSKLGEDLEGIQAEKDLYWEFIKECGGRSFMDPNDLDEPECGPKNGLQGRLAEVL